ncbi:hypothetical protein [Brasilonema bromeliae]|uniref:Uncharacterized protein n=1 Tax=Brasilonema bromeliae SPC951 TaxID=385972 RepID=A0ABX1PDY3_9CYAN|nr:hypothetical protein [Brasilonema bromeliae]NMG21997.1 hypothetical protein [Brasilonema bromeliae SPC951]
MQFTFQQTQGCRGKTSQKYQVICRSGEEVGNDQSQRAFGARYYDRNPHERSPIEQEFARNKAQRGDDD